MQSTFEDLQHALEETVLQLRRSVVEVRSAGHGVGAGTIWRRDGLIVTNHHVAGRDQAGVVLADGRAFQGSILTRDTRNDLAILRIPALDLPAVRVADARPLRPGELVLAVGHPFGVRGALTIGVVSSAHRPAERAQGRELVVADVRLAPGNSGGPLADAQGRVVGINAMVAGGMALAVPSHLVEQLVDSGAGRPRLGLEGQAVTLAPQQAARLEGRFAGGVLITALRADGAAAAAGLFVGDIVLAVAEQPTSDSAALTGVLEGQRGEALPVLFLRGTAVQTVLIPAPAAARAA